MSDYEKQLPQITGTDRPYWEAARKHVLTAYRCLSCGTFYSQATDCIACNVPKMQWVPVSGKGEVFTFCVFHQLYHPAWQGDIPYNVAWIKLDEGPLLMSNVVNCKNEDVKVGMKVQVVFDDVTAEVTLPKFQPLARVRGG